MATGTIFSGENHMQEQSDFRNTYGQGDSIELQAAGLFVSVDCTASMNIESKGEKSKESASSKKTS